MPLCAPPDTTPQSSQSPAELQPLLTTLSPSPGARKRATTNDRDPRNQAVKPADPSLKIASWASKWCLSAGTAPQRGTRDEGVSFRTKDKSQGLGRPTAAAVRAAVGAPTWSSARTRGRPRQGTHIDGPPEKLAMGILVPRPNPRTSTTSSTPSAGTRTFRRERLSVRRRRAMLVLPPPSPSPV